MEASTAHTCLSREVEVKRDDAAVAQLAHRKRAFACGVLPDHAVALAVARGDNRDAVALASNSEAK